MRNKASAYLKQILSLMSGAVRTKSMALKSKTNAIKTRLTILSLIKNKKVFLGSISDKFNSMLHHEHDRCLVHEHEHEHDKAIVMHSAAMANEWQPNYPSYAYPDEMEGGYDYEYEYECEEEYPDLTHTMFETDCEECEEELERGSVIELVRRSKEEVDEEFNLENEIDQVADLFINRFHQKLKLQKQQSIKRYQEMLNRGI